jgi:hypothetical protein
MKRNKNKADSKDSASKNRFNSPGQQDKSSQVQEPETVERQVGQYTGQGVPPMMKK